MPSGRGVGLLLIRSWVLGNEAHENRNGVLLFIFVCSRILRLLYPYSELIMEVDDIYDYSIRRGKIL